VRSLHCLVEHGIDLPLEKFDVSDAKFAQLNARVALTGRQVEIMTLVLGI
jgi:hypothetical protein